MRLGTLLLFSLVISFVVGGSCENRGKGTVCTSGDCPPESGTASDGGELGEIISREMFNELLPNRDNDICPAKGFYAYDAFIEAAKAFPYFGNTGNETMRKKEIAAFFAQTSHNSGAGAPGVYTWGYCHKKQLNPSTDNCDDACPCPLPGQYYGRGPMQLSWNCNYERCGNGLNPKVDLLDNPDLLITDPVLSFKSAIWFWMTPQSPKPSCHEVIIDEWRPSENDINAGRLPGYGLTTNIINGGVECGKEWDDNRIGYFKYFCDKFEIKPGDNLDCANQQPYGLTLMAQSM